MINIYLINSGLIDDDFTGISKNRLSRIMEKYNLTTTIKTNTIDVARASQHSTVVLESYFKIFDNIVHQMNKIDDIQTTWTKWRDVPPENIYNYDEIGPNANEHQPPAIVSIATLLQKQIVWQNSGTGDSKMSFHVTMGVTTQGAGNYHCPKTRQEGATAPFLVVSQSGAIDELEGKSQQESTEYLLNQTDDDDIVLPPSIVQAILEKGSTPEEINPMGLGMRNTKSRSILKSNFLDYIIHFITQVPAGQGPNGETAFLIMDYHAGRANPAAVEYARRHNVAIRILPYKTSITSQPNDSSVNIVLTTLISRNVKRTNICTTDQMSVVDFLKVLKSTWEELVSNESNVLLITEENKATRGFVKTGLCPLDYDCENWTNAIRFFSELSRLERERAEADGVVVSSNT